MDRKKLLAAMFLCVLLFVLALTLSLVFSEDDTGEFASTGSGHIVLSEILASNRTYPTDDGKCLDFIEVRNLSETPTDISGYMLSDSVDSVGYTFPQGTVLPAGGYILCWCDKQANSDNYASFGISKDGGETIYLYNAANVLVDEAYVPRMDTNTAYVRLEDGTWDTAQYATPGYENSAAGYEAWLQSMGSAGTLNVVISEVMSANQSTLLDADGAFTDWIELTNLGSEAAVLDGAYLSDDLSDPLCWQISSLTLEPGESAVIFCGSEAPFALSKNGCSLILTSALGNTLDQVDCPSLGDDRSWARDSEGGYAITDQPTPGFENTEEGWLAFRETQSPAGPLVISEVMPSNARYLQQLDGEYYDWVELVNTSEQTIELSDYALSTDPDSPGMFPLPQMELAPGERLIIICSGDTSLTGTYIHAPFTLSREESWLYVTEQASGSFCDYMRIYDVPYQGSVGRSDGMSGTCYFTTPTPGAENGSGVSLISATPVFLTTDGVYDDVENVCVELSGSGDIRYTLDGSLPTEDSALYTGPITLTATTVVRAAAFEEGRLRSDVVTGSYIINEYHTLPVVSVAANPADLFGKNGIYTNYYSEEEVLCNLKLFENGEGFDIDCGIKMFGHTGLQNPKKSFKINFRGRYGDDLLNYPVYGEDGPQYYDSLLIRSGQDYPRSIFRDELFASLCREMSDDVLAQRDKFCILYINGEYYGIYCMKEAFGETYYAQNKNVSADSVTIVQAPVPALSEIYKLMDFCIHNDMSDPDNYAYVCSQVDIDSLIDWMIIEAYSTNGDIQQNLRYFRSTENGNKWQYALYDLDWTFYEHTEFYHLLSPKQSLQHQGISRSLASNSEFRMKLIQRTSELMATTLSDEHVLARIDYYEQLLDPEVPRERERWNGSYSYWKSSVQRLRDFIAEDHLKNMAYALREYLSMTNDEMEQYFGRWFH